MTDYVPLAIIGTIVALGIILALGSQTKFLWKGETPAEKSRRMSRTRSRLNSRSTRRTSTAVDEAVDEESPSVELQKMPSVASRASLVPKVRAARGSIASKITNLMSVGGRQSVKDLQEEAGYVVTADQLEVEVLRAPPVKVLEDERWQVHGVYTHVLLKVGLRHLDATWPDGDLLDLAGGRLAAGKGLRQESLLKGLLSGDLNLKSVAASDITAAQYDLQRLSLRQLLKIRVHHLDFTPSGAAVDSISTLQNQHEAFLNTLDGMLFKILGKKAVGDAAEVSADDAHRFGREAVQFVAADIGLESAPTRRWAWWLDKDRRVFFTVADFASTSSFPSEGVLEVDDRSKRDAIEPSGRLMWFDWHVSVVRDETELSRTPLASVGSKGKGHQDDDGDEEGGSPGVGVRKSKSVNLAGGASPSQLVNLRQSLKKVSTTPLLDEDGQPAEEAGGRVEVRKSKSVNAGADGHLVNARQSLKKAPIASQVDEQEVQPEVGLAKEAGQSFEVQPEVVPVPEKEASLPTIVVPSCSSCGAEIKEGAAFCNKCGFAFGSEAALAEPSQHQEPVTKELLGHRAQSQVQDGEAYVV